MIRMCCVCHRVELAGQWYADFFLTEHERLTHGYCPDCLASVMAETEEIFAIMGQPAWAARFRPAAMEQRGRCA
ncbi:MAG: hypothetical protein FWG62_04335 [Proteobacteria bacterium]|nr:hypothetical protein [Pseudomonadota bacterium]